MIKFKKTYFLLVLTLPALVLASYVYFNRHVIINRYTDSIWHICAAEEYAKTGIFAKDPFIQNSPPFAQFGLMEFLGGFMQRTFTINATNSFIALNMLFAALFYLVSITAGCLLFKRLSYALILTFISYASIVAYGATVIRSGWPFSFALALLILASILLWQVIESTSPRDRILWGVSLGATTGIIFDLHAFVGLMGGIALFCWLLVEVIYKPKIYLKDKSFICSCILALGLFLLLASPWILMFIELKPTLAGINSHNDLVVSHIESKHWFLGVVALLTALINLHLDRETKYRSLNRGMLVFTILSLAAGIPPLNRLLAEKTSAFMAERILLFIPVPIIGSMAIHIFFKQSMQKKCHLSMGKLTYSILLALLLLPLITNIFDEFKLQVFLTRTKIYDDHPYSFLNELSDIELEGNVVLSDPYTSYFARYFLSTYAVSVPSGHASPAINYESRDQVYRTALSDIDSAINMIEFDYIIINTKECKEFYSPPMNVLSLVIKNLTEKFNAFYTSDTCAVFLIANPNHKNHKQNLP